MRKLKLSFVYSFVIDTLQTFPRTDIRPDSNIQNTTEPAISREFYRYRETLNGVTLDFLRTYPTKITDASNNNIDEYIS